MQPWNRQSVEFWQPSVEILTRGIKFLGLKDGIENAEVGGCVGPATRGPLPTQRVIRQIRINERIPEPFRSPLPGHKQVLHEE